MKTFLLLAVAIAIANCQPPRGNSHDDIWKANKRLLNRKGTRAFSTSKDPKPEEIWEGDIVMSEKLKKTMKKVLNKESISPFDAITNGAWPGAVVRYEFARNFPYRSAVMEAIKEYNQKTCIKFLPRRSTDRSYIHFFVGGGCYSMIGRQGGRQQVSLGRGCGTKGVAIHEMMHALGFFHEQSRLDRDKYITIHWSNIPSGVRYNFEKYKVGQADTLGEAYDKNSVMHYGNYAFSNNNRQTISSKSNSNERLGQRNGLSVIDAKQLNKYYKCAGTKPGPKPSPPSPSQCTDGYDLCSTLARVGLCNVTVDWVRTNCKKSCKKCTSKPKCVNQSHHGSCNYWMQRRYCTQGKFVPWMQKTCAVCGTCSN